MATATDLDHVIASNHEPAWRLHMVRFVVLGFCLAPLMVSAQVFKCVDGAGAITFSNVPCPAGDGAATLIRVAPANTLSSEPYRTAPEDAPSRSEDAPSRSNDSGGRVTVVGESSDYEERIQFQVNSLLGLAGRAQHPGAASAYRAAARLVGFAPRTRAGLMAAQDAVTAADRGNPAGAMNAAKIAAAMTPEGRAYLDSRRNSSRGDQGQPRVITSCDPGGCWDNLGGRYAEGGGDTYVPTSGGPACQKIGVQMICP